MAEFDIHHRIQDAAELKTQATNMWELKGEVVLSLSDSVDRKLIGEKYDELAELLLAEAGKTLVGGLEVLERLALATP